MEDRLFKEIVHHIEHFVLYSLVWWQIVLGVWLVLKWVNKHWKIKKTFSVTSPTENKTQTLQPVINIDGTVETEKVCSSIAGKVPRTLHNNIIYK